MRQHAGVSHTSEQVSHPSPQALIYSCASLPAGLHGYSHMTGGWEGGQAEYARVAFADQNLLKIPDEGPDEKYLLLSVRVPNSYCHTSCTCVPACGAPSGLG